MTIDNAVYAKGHRTADPRNLQETYEVLRDRGELAWIGLYRPDAEIRAVATEFEWHELPVQEAISAHQRPSWSVRSDALTVNAAAVVGQRQNEEMRTLTEASLAQNEEVKRISAWAAILFAPP